MSDLEGDFKRNNAFLLYGLIWLCPSTRTPAPGAIKCTILVNRSLVIIIHYITNLSDQCQGVKKKNVLHQFYSFYPKIVFP